MLMGTVICGGCNHRINSNEGSLCKLCKYTLEMSKKFGAEDALLKRSDMLDNYGAERLGELWVDAYEVNLGFKVVKRNGDVYTLEISDTFGILEKEANLLGVTNGTFMTHVIMEKNGRPKVCNSAIPTKCLGTGLEILVIDDCALPYYLSYRFNVAELNAISDTIKGYSEPVESKAEVENVEHELSATDRMTSFDRG